MKYIGWICAAVALLAGVTAWLLLTAKDAPETFLEDDPQVRAHPDYPVRVKDVDALAGTVVVERDVPIPLRDGTQLSANVFRPAGPGPFPVVMAFTA